MREWIVTNGLGGYASLTHTMEATRKFHGLLIASLSPPVKRWLFISNIYDTLILNNKEYRLQDYPPHFSFKWFPTFTYKIEEVIIKKAICMPYPQNTTIIRYQIQSNEPCLLQQYPIINSRHLYDLSDNDSINFQINQLPGRLVISPDNIDHKITISSLFSDFHYLGRWEKAKYKLDQHRNDSYIEFNYSVGILKYPIQNIKEYYLILSIEPTFSVDGAKAFAEDLSRKKQIVMHAQLPTEMNPLLLASDQFIVQRNSGKSIIAGYHWFSDWGRDTLISLPGITLITNRFDEAKDILTNFAQYCHYGLIPNTFSERNSEAQYNTVDASLWFIDRVYQYLKYTNDTEIIKELWPILESIIKAYRFGTKHNIHMDSDCLISHDPGLTWMDVKLGDYYPTPRGNKAIEIQALWYNALCIMASLAQIIDKQDNYSELATEVKKTICAKYTKLFDVLDTLDTTIRPNMLFLISLDYSPISKTCQKEIISTADSCLRVIFGLRTLDPNNPQYKGNYIGKHHRDIAYHNGTVWPWLLGSFITGFLKIHNYSLSARSTAYDKFLAPMLRIFGQNWDGSIPEIFDGDPPFSPRGCITQAWSVAEILRAWVEDIKYIRPSYEKTIEDFE